MNQKIKFINNKNLLKFKFKKELYIILMKLKHGRKDFNNQNVIMHNPNVNYKIYKMNKEDQKNKIQKQEHHKLEHVNIEINKTNENFIYNHISSSSSSSSIYLDL